MCLVYSVILQNQVFPNLKMEHIKVFIFAVIHPSEKIFYSYKIIIPRSYPTFIWVIFTIFFIFVLRNARICCFFYTFIRSSLLNCENLRRTFRISLWYRSEVLMILKYSYNSINKSEFDLFSSFLTFSKVLLSFVGIFLLEDLQHYLRLTSIWAQVVNGLGGVWTNFNPIL